jgi:hypothetical protein
MGPHLSHRVLRTRNLPQHPSSIRLYLQHGIQPDPRLRTQPPLVTLYLTLLSFPPSPISVPAQGLSSGICKQGFRVCSAHHGCHRAGAVRFPSVEVYHRRTRVVAFVDGADHEVLVRFLGGGRVR